MAKKELPSKVFQPFDLDVEIVMIAPNDMLGASWANYARAGSPENFLGETVQHSTLNSLVPDVNNPLLVRPIHPEEVKLWKEKIGGRTEVTPPKYTIVDGFGRFADHNEKHGPTCEIPCKVINIVDETGDDFINVRRRSAALSYSMNATQKGTSWMDNCLMMHLAGGAEADVKALADISPLTKKQWLNYLAIFKKFGSFEEIHRRYAENPKGCYSRLLKAATGGSSDSSGGGGTGAKKLTGSQLSKYIGFAVAKAEKEFPRDKDLHLVLKSTEATLRWLASDQSDDLLDFTREAGLHSNDEFGYDFVLDGKADAAAAKEAAAEAEDEDEGDKPAPAPRATKKATKKAAAPRATKKATKKSAKKATAPAPRATKKKPAKKTAQEQLAAKK